MLALQILFVEWMIDMNLVCVYIIFLGGLRNRIVSVLAMVANPHFVSGSGLESNWNYCNACRPIKKPNCT